MLKLVFILVFAITGSAFAQEDYQETDYSIGSSDQEIDRNVASEGMEAPLEMAPVPEDTYSGNDYSAE